MPSYTELTVRRRPPIAQANRQKEHKRIKVLLGLHSWSGDEGSARKFSFLRHGDGVH